MPMHVIGPIPVMTARRSLPFRTTNSTPRFEIRFHVLQGLACDVMNEEAPNDWIGDWRERWDAEFHFVDDLHEHALRSFIERPDHIHAFREFLQMMEAHLKLLAVDHLLGGP